MDNTLRKQYLFQYILSKYCSPFSVLENYKLICPNPLSPKTEKEKKLTIHPVEQLFGVEESGSSGEDRTTVTVLLPNDKPND